MKYFQNTLNSLEFGVFFYIHSIFSIAMYVDSTFRMFFLVKQEPKRNGNMITNAKLLFGKNLYNLVTESLNKIFILNLSKMENLIYHMKVEHSKENLQHRVLNDIGSTIIYVMKYTKWNSFRRA